MGEFSCVLGAAAAALGAITSVQYVALVATVIVSIAVSSITVRVAGPGPATARA